MGGPGVEDNRTGLGVLLEMARSWPRNLSGRVEVRFVATGALALDAAGAQAVARQIVEEWPPKPTLLINLHAPGCSTKMFLLGKGQVLEQAEAAAKSLWIPKFRLVTQRSGLGPLGHHPPECEGQPAVSLIGYMPWTRKTDLNGNRPTFIDPAGVAAAAQLATEIALRWAKLQGAAPQVDSLAQSSQNPG